jgi:hypothetical protein
LNNKIDINVGDLVSWRGTKELGIVLAKQRSIMEEKDDLLVSFISSTSNTDSINWYDSKNFIKVAEDTVAK